MGSAEIAGQVMSKALENLYQVTNRKYKKEKDMDYIFKRSMFSVAPGAGPSRSCSSSRGGYS